MTEFLNALRKLIETFAPALAVMIWDFQQEKLDEAKTDARDAVVQLQIEKNHEAINEKYAGKSDADVLLDGIDSDGTGQSGATDKTNKPES